MPKIVNHTEYREELLGKCFELFARSGFQSLTMREIGTNETFFQNVLFLIIDYYRQNGLKDPENFIRDIERYYRKSLGDLIGLGDSPAVGALFTFCLGLVVQSMITSEGKEREEILLIIKQMLDTFIRLISNKVI